MTHFHDWMSIKTNLNIQKTKRVIGGDWCTKITMINVIQKSNFFGLIGCQEFHHIDGSFMFINLYHFCFDISLGINDIAHNELIAR